MKNLKKLAAVFASSTALLGGCNLMDQPDRYSYQCLTKPELNFTFGTLHAPRGYDVSFVDGPKSMQLVAVSGTDRLVEPTPIPNGADCSLTKMTVR